MKAIFSRRILVSLAIVVALLLLGALYPALLEWPLQTIDRLMDRSEPEVRVDLPQGYVHGPLAVRIVVRDDSGAAVTGLSIDGEPIPSAEATEIDTSKLPDGEHTLIVEATDRSLRKNTVQGFFTFRTDNTPPTLAAQADPPQVGQGRSMAVKISLSEPVTLTGSLDGRSISVLPTESGYVSILGFGPETKTGARSLELNAVDKAGLQAKVQIPITVTRVDYPTESLVIPEDRSDLLGPAVGDAENSFLDKVYGATTPEKLWSGSFLMPGRGVTSSPFAIRRSYNGGPYGSHHGGIDLAIAEGVPVVASNRGRVVLAEPLKVRGNVVILDHGLGVYSAYFHLSAIRVTKDQMVDKGQTIGLVGNTGLSTGAHLHWEMRVTGSPVDPLEWTTRIFP